MVDYNVTDKIRIPHTIRSTKLILMLSSVNSIDAAGFYKTYFNFNNHIITQNLVSIPCLPISAGVLEKLAFVQDTILMVG